MARSMEPSDAWGHKTPWRHPGVWNTSWDETPVDRTAPRPCSTVTSQKVQQQPRSKAQENKPHQNKVHSSSDPSTTTADSAARCPFLQHSQTCCSLHQVTQAS